MARPTDQTCFIEALKAAGGRAPNGQLQEALSWSETKYWRVHQELFEAGRVERGRGRGGSVLLVSESAKGISASEAASQPERVVLPAFEPTGTQLTGELALYDPIQVQLSRHWALRRQLDECHCEVIALQGRRETGGSWSRPDLCVIGARKFEFFPDRVFELHTFEVKGDNDVTIKGVLEALAHREAATRSYVLYHTNGEEFLTYPESSRIVELATRHGIGVIAAGRVDNVDSWDEVVAAQRANSDPETINTFMGRSLSEEAKRKIRRWFSW